MPCPKDDRCAATCWPGPTAGALERVEALLAGAPREKGFGNARLARNLFEAVVARHASRVVGLAAPTDDDLTRLLPEDVPDELPG